MTGSHSIEGSGAPGEIERPVKTHTAASFGSDIIAQELRDLGVAYVALNPGSSYRGLHDSLVNHLGNADPQLLLCLHEEHAVALAHGYAKVTGRAMAAAVHSNVGLFHASMAIFNAWCDRMPVLVLGATGPVDAAKRRPWIDWIHTAADQGAIVRHYVKWDDQPASPQAAQDAIRRGMWASQSAPCAPVYLNFDVSMQEEPLPAGFEPRPAEPRYHPNLECGPPIDALERIAKDLKSAKHPLFVIGRVSRSRREWDERVALVEALGAKVLTDMRVGAAFPTGHPLHAAPPTIFPGPEAIDVIRQADLIVSLDAVDLGGLFRAAWPDHQPTAQIVHVSLDHTLHNGWSQDHQIHPPADHRIACDPAAFVSAVSHALGIGKDAVPFRIPVVESETRAPDADAPIDVSLLAAALRAATIGRAVSLLRLPLSWKGEDWPFSDPLDYLGGQGGAGIGGGPGNAVGSALALMGAGRLPVAILGDGDFLMGATALWTATHYRIPLLIIVANNRSLYNDEVHQARVAKTRGRPIENKWIGQRLSDPEIDIAGLGRAQGALGIGPIDDWDALTSALRQAVRHVDEGGVAVLDVFMPPEAGNASAKGAA